MVEAQKCSMSSDLFSFRVFSGKLCGSKSLRPDPLQDGSFSLNHQVNVHNQQNIINSSFHNFTISSFHSFISQVFAFRCF